MQCYIVVPGKSLNKKHYENSGYVTYFNFTVK